MSSLEQVFIKEFKRSIRTQRVSKNIYEVPLPIECSNWNVSGTHQYGVIGISAESGGLFSKLNKTVVDRLPQGAKVRRKKIDLVNKRFVKDSRGNLVYESVRVPQGSVPVISNINLNLPYRYSVDEEGFGYIDFIKIGSEKKFLYYIPKKYLYKANQTALALSVKNMKNYAGMGYVTWRFGTIYLHIIPYNSSRSYIGTKILKTSLSLNYDYDIKCIVDFWVKNGVVPNIKLCNTLSEGNLVLKPTTKGYDEYKPIERKSLAEEGELYE